MESKTNKYHSRILREMHHQTEHPFSPPSSSGTHGTVTLTSNFTLGPQGESTRRVDDYSANLPTNAAMRNTKAQPSTLNLNTSALGRTFPEWSRWNPSGPDQEEKDMWEIASDEASVPDGKENLMPPGSPISSVASNFLFKEGESNGKDKSRLEDPQPSNVSKDTVRPIRKYLRTRAQMQAHVQNESDCSMDLSEPVAHTQHSEKATRPQMSTPKAAKDHKPRRGNVTALLETLKTAQIKQAESQEQSGKHVSPQPQPSVQPRNAAKMHMERQAGMSSLMSPSTPNQTARSFFLPGFSHMNDFLSGALKLSSLKNGMPIFVKHGKVHDRESTTFPDHHADVEAVSIPEDEEKIFVSLDKIKDEIYTLKEHDELVSKQAELLQEEVEELHVQIAEFRSRKDSAIGSDSESSMVGHLSAQKSKLEEQVDSLQARLDKANRKNSLNEIHTESYVRERDEALKTASEHLEKIKDLQAELDAAREQLKMAREDDTRSGKILETEIKSLRRDNNSVRQQWKSLLEENKSLRAYNSDIAQQNADLEHDLQVTKGQFEALERDFKLLAEEKAVLKQDNLSMEHHNDQFYNDNKILKEENSSLDRKKHDLQDEVDRLKQKLDDATSAKTGPTSVEVKSAKYRLQAQNRELAEENAELQQNILTIQADFSSKFAALKREKRQLASTNQRLTEQINKIRDQFEHIVQESNEEIARYEDKQAALTQELELIADKESTLIKKLKKSADQEALLQSELARRAEAINDARQITQGIKDFMDAVSREKAARAARDAEPKDKSVAGETTAKSITSQSDIPMQDDYTQQIDLTQGSDFASIFTQGEMPKQRDSLRQVRQHTQQDSADDSSDFDDDGVSEQASQSLPAPFVPRGQTRATSSQRGVSGEAKKPQPVGILKDATPRSNLPRQKVTRTVTETGSHELNERDTTTTSADGVRKSRSDEASARKVSFNQPDIQMDSELFSEPEFTGLSARSGISGMSIPSEISEVDKVHSRASDSAQLDVETDHEENMTSALFMEDITLEQRKTAEKVHGKKAKTELSKDAKRVLDDLCHDHDCRNCIVCSRINSRPHQDGNSSKGAIRVEKPIPASERVSNEAAYQEESTIRPSQDPATAVAKVIKGLKDEERHLKNALRKKNAVYNECDPSVHRRVWKKLGKEIEKLHNARDLKRDQIYYLYDAVEAFKKSGQEMPDHFAEMTIMSALSKDPTWNGIVDC
ncbi:hypothetical protein GGR53DRAFT_497116 [Hypoxylon sp. FL1150]|nr:hypothetical protein GGR53DRAFT_497116 [Hypoxylon sp. FL1150]